MPSISPGRPTNRPNSVMFLTSPSSSVPTGCFSAKLSHGLAHGLLEAEADAALLRIDVEHHHLDLLAGRDDLAGMDVLLGPAHLGDMDQALDAGLQLDEGAVIGDVGDAALEACAPAGYLSSTPSHGSASSCFMPSEMRCVSGLKRMTCTLTRLADMQRFGRMVDAPPRDVGDVQQAVDAAQIDEGAVIGDVLDDAGEDLAFLEAGDQLRALPRRGSPRARRGATRRCCRASGPS